MIGLARLGRDAELRYSTSGKAVANLSLAVSYGQKGQDGNRPTQWIEASIWEKQAEVMAPFMVKGSVHCFTLSDVHIETYQKNGGGEGTKLVARVDRVELGPRVDGGQARQAAPAPAPRAAPAPRPPAPAPAARQSSGFDDEDDSDIPF